jgi:hypothetical protein
MINGLFMVFFVGVVCSLLCDATSCLFSRGTALRGRTLEGHPYKGQRGPRIVASVGVACGRTANVILPYCGKF